MLDQMEAQVMEFRAALEALQKGDQSAFLPATAVKRRGRPSKALLAAANAEAENHRPVKPNKRIGISKRGKVITDPYWSKFTTDERIAEMRRRRAKSQAKAEAAK